MFLRLLRWIRLRFDRCPNCGRRFNYWFFWPHPDIGEYCYPCYSEHKKIFTRNGMNEIAISESDKW